MKKTRKEFHMNLPSWFKMVPKRIFWQETEHWTLWSILICIFSTEAKSSINSLGFFCINFFFLITCNTIVFYGDLHRIFPLGGIMVFICIYVYICTYVYIDTVLSCLILSINIWFNYAFGQEGEKIMYNPIWNISGYRETQEVFISCQ